MSTSYMIMVPTKHRNIPFIPYARVPEPHPMLTAFVREKPQGAFDIIIERTTNDFFDLRSQPGHAGCSVNTPIG
jgi:hypothetical protein